MLNIWKILTYKINKLFFFPAGHCSDLEFCFQRITKKIFQVVVYIWSFSSSSSNVIFLNAEIYRSFK